MSRRCRPLFAAAVAAAVLAPAAGLAQTPPASQWPNSGTLPPNTGTGETPDIGALPPRQNPDDNLLAPSLDGNPNGAPRFRRQNGGDIANQPPASRFTAPSRIGATPTYGSPQAFGSGDTGYDSMNLSKNQRKKLQARVAPAPPPGVPAQVPETTFDPVPTTQFAVPPPAPTQLQAPAAEIYPKKAATRPGAVLPGIPQPAPLSNPLPEVYPLPASTRPGATLQPPPALDAEETAREALFNPNATASTPPPGVQPPNTYPLGTVQLGTLPIGPDDPFAPVGIRGGSFMFFPSVDLSAAYDSNPQRIPGGAGSPYFIVAPDLKVQSLWSRHSLTADISGNWTQYTNNSFVPSLSRPYFNSVIDGRIDVTRETQILLESRVLVNTTNPGNPNLQVQAGLASLPITTSIGGTLGLSQDLGKLNLTLRGTIDRLTVADSKLTDGSTSSNAFQDYNQYAVIGRATYAITPEVKPFVEVQTDTRVYDDQFDANGQQRTSNGANGKFGTTLAMTNSLTGEMAIGYMERTYRDPGLPSISGPTLDGSLIWQATGLTTAKITATSIVSESILQGVSGSLSRDLSLEVDHAFRPWVIGNVLIGKGHDDYVGLGRNDDRYYVASGVTYKFNREVQLKGELRHDWLTSNVSGVANNSTSVLIGAHLQR